MRNLETKYAGLTLRNPLIVGSSGLTSKADKNGKWEEAGAGAVVLKSLFEEQIEAQGDLLMAGASDYPEAEDYVRAYVRANGREEYLQLIRDSKAACHVIPVIASVNCYRADTWADFAAEIERAGADALELNVFYLDTDIHSDSREVLRQYSSILKDVRRRISIPIIMKIGKGFSTIPAFVNRLQGFGANAVVLFNRYYRPDIDIERCRIVAAPPFSDPSELGDTLRWTAIVSGALPDMPIAASTGVHTWQDAIKCILAGASAVQLCSTLYKHGAKVIPEMITQIADWMERTKYESVEEFRGRLSLSNAADASMYERTQFMKYISSRETI